MTQEIREDHRTDHQGAPAGGRSSGIGFIIIWQEGPRGRGPLRLDQHGALPEDLLRAVAGRLQFFQASDLSCQENKDALYHIDQALLALNARRERRQAEGIHGTTLGG